MNIIVVGGVRTVKDRTRGAVCVNRASELGNERNVEAVVRRSRAVSAHTVVIDYVLDVYGDVDPRAGGGADGRHDHLCGIEGHAIPLSVDAPPEESTHQGRHRPSQEGY